MKKRSILALCLVLALCAAGFAGTEQPGPAAQLDPEQITFDGLTVVDGDQCSIQITEIVPDDLWGYTLKVTMENRSADVNYMFAVETGYVNGVMCDPFFATEIPAGKKSNEEISFQVDKLEKYGVAPVTDIELLFRVHDADDWQADAVYQEAVHVYPYGQEWAQPFVRESAPEDVVLADDDNVTVIVTGYEPDGMWGYTVDLFLANKTDTDAMFSVDDASVNGYMADPFYACSVGAGRCAFSSMSWSDSALEKNGIESVEELEFALRVYDDENWSKDDYVNHVVTLTP